MSVNAIETTPDEGFDVGLIEGLHRPWWNSAWEEFGAAFRLAEKLPPLPQYRDAVAGERDFQGLILDDLRVSWYKSIPAQLPPDLRRPQASSGEAELQAGCGPRVSGGRTTTAIGRFR